jgi:hypothetical protein
MNPQTYPVNIKCDTEKKRQPLPASRKFDKAISPYQKTARRSEMPNDPELPSGKTAFEALLTLV